VVIAAVALHEVVRPLQAMGMVMVLASILVVQRSTTDVVCSSVDPVD
jgi:drug/metabolite transporter (DMT)-like permease